MIKIDNIYYTINYKTACVTECEKDAKSVLIHSSIIKKGVIYPIITIETFAFECCNKLTNVNIEKGVTLIKDEAFRKCTSLTEITIPNSVEFIGVGSFSDCTSLKEISIPNSVKSIGEYAFSGCDSLKKAFVSKHTKISKNSFPEHTEIIRQ